MPDALFHLYGKPVDAGGPMTIAVHGTPGNRSRRDVVLAAMGSPTPRETRYRDLHFYGSRSLPEAVSGV